jgi:DNA-binding transcriptional ArsR family regulator
LKNTKYTPSLNGERVATATSLLRAFNHKLRFAIVERLMNEGGKYPCQLADDLRLRESYIMEHLAALQQSGIVRPVDLPDGVKFAVNKRMVRKVQDALRGFSQN